MASFDISPRTMQKLANTLSLAVLGLCFVAALTIDPAQADVFGTVMDKGRQTFVSIRNTVYVLCGLGIIGLGVLGIFGRWQWRWLFSMAGGLLLIAVAGFAIDYLTGGSSGIENSLS